MVASRHGHPTTECLAASDGRAVMVRPTVARPDRAGCSDRWIDRSPAGHGNHRPPARGGRGDRHHPARAVVRSPTRDMTTDCRPGCWSTTRHLPVPVGGETARSPVPTKSPCGSPSWPWGAGHRAGRRRPGQRAADRALDPRRSHPARPETGDELAVVAAGRSTVLSGWVEVTRTPRRGGTSCSGSEGRDERRACEAELPAGALLFDHRGDFAGLTLQSGSSGTGRSDSRIPTVVSRWCWAHLKPSMRLRLISDAG